MDRPNSAFDIGIDTKNGDDAVDWTLPAQRTVPQTFVPLFLVTQGADLAMLGLPPDRACALPAVVVIQRSKNP